MSLAIVTINVGPFKIKLLQARPTIRFLPKRRDKKNTHNTASAFRNRKKTLVVQGFFGDYTTQLYIWGF